jgi:hypothetical protein
VHSVSDVRQTEILTAGPLVPGPSSLEVGNAIAKLKKYASPVSNQIAEEIIQVGGETLLGIRANCLISVRNVLLYLFTKTGDNSDCSTYCRISDINVIQKFIAYPYFKVKSK